MGAQEVVHGDTLVRPADPVRSFYTFAGWHTDEACSSPYDFSRPVYDITPFTLYACWRWIDNNLQVVVSHEQEPEGVGALLANDTIRYVAPCGVAQLRIWVADDSSEKATVPIPLQLANDLDTCIAFNLPAGGGAPRAVVLKLGVAPAFTRFVVSQLGGRLFMVINNRKNNGGFKFSSVRWRTVDAGGAVRRQPTENFYYVPATSAATVYDVALQDSATGMWRTTCRYAPDSAVGEAAARGAAYPNPVTVGGKIRLTEASFSSAATFLLIDAQGGVAQAGSAEALRQEGIRAPDIPGIYYLVIEEKAGRRSFKIVVVPG